MSTAIVIGRNEGDRLITCLQSLKSEGVEIVYVDSQSLDNSVLHAREAGALVVELTNEQPVNAARARQAGFNALQAMDNLPEFIQFLDGDCTVVPGWFCAGEAALREDPNLGLVTGWRVELHPERSVYNALCEFEWHRPAGEISVCGGDMMVRSSIFAQVGGFDSDLIACEDFDFCLRLGKAGAKLKRLPVNMTMHDANMTQFGQWWRRSVRAGHGNADVGARHPIAFRRELTRAWVYGGLLPLVFIMGLGGASWLSLSVVAAYSVNYFRTLFGLMVNGLTIRQAPLHTALILLSKFPNLLGMLLFYVKRARGKKMQIIEYK